MEEKTYHFSLDSKRVDDKEVRLPTLFPVSIITSAVQFTNDIPDIRQLRDKIQENVLTKFPFEKSPLKAFKEGFLEFTSTVDNVLNCYYGKEASTKIMFEADDLRIHSERFSLLNPAYTVRIKVILTHKSARIVMFGGSEALISKAVDRIFICIVRAISGGHSFSRAAFSKTEMNQILKKFGLNVEYIWIHPVDSKNFVKYIEKKEGEKITKIPQYFVHAKLHGFHITGSPIVISLIEESGVYIKEMQGKMIYATKKDITSRISSEGKAIFVIPETLIPPNNSAYEIAEGLYEKLIEPIATLSGSKQASLGEFS